MVKFEALLGQLSVKLAEPSVTASSNSNSPCEIHGMLILVGRDLLGPGDAKTAWELLGYEVGIQQFKITFDAPVYNYRTSSTDRPAPGHPPKEQIEELDMIRFLPRQWTRGGQIAVGFSIAIPDHLLPPRGMTHRYQLAASVTVAVINKDLGMGPNFMHRIAAPISFEVACPASGTGWPWPQQHGLN